MKLVRTLYLCPSGISIINYLRNRKVDMSSGVEKTIIDFLKKEGADTLMKASAEINSLFRMGIAKGDKVIFLSSDTDEGEMVATCLKKTLIEMKECSVTVRRIKGLQIEDRKIFDQFGIPNLTDTIIDEVDNHSFQFKIVLNITAGYKATVPYLTFIGMIFHLPIRYIFEESESIIELPPIPMDFDKERLKRLEPVINYIASDYMHINEFREKVGISYNDIEQDTQDILLKVDDFITLRPTGKILYKRYLQFKGNTVYISPLVSKKIQSNLYDKKTFENIFRKMQDPVYLGSKLHSEIKKKGKIDLECYKAGSTNERVFFYAKNRSIYICDILMHDEYERILKQGEMLRANFEQEEKKFERFY